MKLRLATAFALVLVAAAPAAHAAPTASTGLFGAVRRGPTTPVCQVGKPCSAPAQETLVFTRAGREAARTRSRPDGSYRVVLAPGAYVVKTTRTGLGSRVEPSYVRVPRLLPKRQNFFVDTGIR